MKLTQIDIKNFRSIKNITIDINNNCIILVGKNEAGKSNILKAIAGGLNPKEYQITPKDKRKKGPKEKIEKDDYFIEYYFKLNETDIGLLIKQYFDDSIYNNLFKLNDKTLSIHEFLSKYFSKGLYKYDILEMKGWARYYTLPTKLLLTKKIAKITTNFTDTEGNKYYTNEFIDIDKIDVDESYYKIYSVEDIKTLFVQNFLDFIKNNLPKTILWEYDDKYLIPQATDLQDFINNPEEYLPLQNIFNLAGYTDIKLAFENAMDEDGDYINLLDNVSQVATKEFAKKWPDLKKIQIILSKDGDEILSKVKEKVSYNFEDRSDGFKKFISILLMLSTRVDTGIIKNAVILIDEPDRSLYPTGAKYLRDELIKISENNIVFYSTHSPFMIDQTNLSRHLIVEKNDDDITNIAEVSDSNFRDDEVLLNAIGTSNFEFIQTNNIIFEGWGDNKLFKTALKSKEKEYKNILKFFNQFGVTFAHGVRDIKTITPLLKLADKNVFIFTDSDEAAKKAKESYQKENGYMNGNWFTFEDLGGNKDETLEDYIDENFLQQVLNNVKEGIKIEDNTKNLPVMQFLFNRLNKNEKWEFKNYITNNLETKYIKDSYFKILSNFKDKIEEFLKCPDNLKE